MNVRQTVAASLLGILLVAASIARAASFECTKAKAPVEKMICSDAALSDLDGRLAAAYRRALGPAANPGIDVLRTYESGGGSGEFENLMLVRLVEETGGAALDSPDWKSQTMSFKKKRIVIKKLGEIGLGDRWDGRLKITGNEISIGK